jgi:anti-sigma factor RsiW
MNCGEANALLSELLDDELPEAARAGVEAHVASCERCAGDFRKLARTVRFVRANVSQGTRTAMGRAEEELMRAATDETYGKDPVHVLVEYAPLVFPPGGAGKEDQA